MKARRQLAALLIVRIPESITTAGITNMAGEIIMYIRNVPKRVPWTKQQLIFMEMLLVEAGNNKIDWYPHLEALGHAHHAVVSRAVMMRAAMRLAEEDKRRMACAVDDALHVPRIAREIDLDAHRINTSTQGLQFSVEMRARIGMQGITAGLLGDPTPGRSALDLKLGRYTGPPEITQRGPSLAGEKKYGTPQRRGPRHHGARHHTDKPAARVLMADKPGTPAIVPSS